MVCAGQKIDWSERRCTVAQIVAGVRGFESLETLGWEPWLQQFFASRAPPQGELQSPMRTWLM